MLVVGLGGLGAPAAVYLAGAGIGTLVLADDDAVHLSNLQRQILFTTDDINQPKPVVTAQRLQQLNPDIALIPLQQRLNGEALRQQVAQADVVLDCSDNMVTRQAVNAACVALETPLVTASAVGFGGQLMVLTPPGSKVAIAACGRTKANRNATAARRGLWGRWWGSWAQCRHWKPSNC